MKLTKKPALAKKISHNRNNYFLKQEINPELVVSAEIVHGNQVVTVDYNDSGKIIQSADGLVSKNKEIYLSVTSADCLPIFLFEPKKEIIGMIHAGWRSLEKGILSNAIKKIVELGGIPKNILVGIGPSICQKHYEIGPEVAAKFVKYSEALKKENNRTYLDLGKIAVLQLLGLGIKKDNIEISSECTFELYGKYFSARRDQKKEIEAMIAIIGMKK